ncbi:MAG: phosphoenolpyruvate carboxylase [Myxococcales bacterium]|nr:phosphoenolpyruvate carboxylase [Myxococcales bacterium]
MKCFQEMLAELGEKDLARSLPWASAPENQAPMEMLCSEAGLQALSLSFQLLNMVEENSAAQTRRRVEHERGLAAEPGLWGDRLNQMRLDGCSEEEIADLLPRIWVEPVLTAHPTEAKRSSLLEQHRQLYLLLLKRENNIWTPAEQEQIRGQIILALERIWRTGEIMLQKPDLAHERRAILYFLHDVFPEVVPRLDWRLRQAWKEAGFDPRRLAGAGRMPLVSFGTWVGGDRDGHGLVTAAVTNETLLALRRAALGLHDRHLQAVAQRLSLSSARQAPPAELAAAIDELTGQLGEIGAQAVTRNPFEPWRQFLNLVRAKLPNLDDCRIEAPYHYRHPRALLEHLRLLYESLVAVGAARLAEEEVLPVWRAVEVFGFHLAVLDVRQNSAYHDRAIAQLLVAAGLDGADYADWPEEKRRELLEQELKSPRPLAHGSAELGPEAREILATYRLLASHGEEYGYDGIGALIVSMTRSVSDLLGVYLLAREAGLARPTPAGLVCRLPVVPLFETVADLEQAPAILREFLAHPITGRSVTESGGRRRQQVMLGYSDSAKAAGVLSGQWALHQAQRTLAQMAAEAGFELRFFHGRGGTISRGAGPTHRFLQSLPHGSLSGAFRATEQGETISQKYANLGTASYNLELLVAGVAAMKLRHQRPVSRNVKLAPIMHLLATRSQKVYEDLLDRPDFMAYFSQATPIDAIEQARIGSRPARRTGRRTLEDLRAIPWVFAWNQSRHYLPGWYGVGTALTELLAEVPARFADLAAGFENWPFLQYVFTNTETSLMSADLRIVERYAELVADDAVRATYLTLIGDEYRRTREVLGRLFGGDFAVRRPRLLGTLVRRERALTMLHQMQIMLLRQWRERSAAGDQTGAEALLPRVLLSVNAIASGLRTTG